MYTPYTLATALLRLLCTLLLHLLPLRDPIRRLIPIQRAGPKHHGRPNLHHPSHLIPKQPDTQHKANQLANVQHYRHRNRRSISTKNIDARDAQQLRDRVGSEVDDVLRRGREGLVERGRELRGDAERDGEGLRGLQARELLVEDGREAGEHGDREQVRVEEVGLPVFAVLVVDIFDVGAHPGGEELGDEQDGEAGFEGTAG
jgi:hypothetical protein